MFAKSAALRRIVRYLLLALLLTLPVWASFTRPGLPATSIGPLPVLRLHALANGQDSILGHAPDRWRGDGPWAYIVGRAALALGFDGVAAIKISTVLALLLLGLGLYVWATRMAAQRGAVLAVLLVLYAPVLLAALFLAGELAAIWVLAGLALAGWGLTREGWVGVVLAALGALIALASLPGMGLLAMAALLILAVGTRRWRGAGGLLVGGMLGLLWSTPWTRPVITSLAFERPSLHQLIEPGWFWDTMELGRESAPVFALGLPLLGLLIIAIWSHPRPRDPQTEAARHHVAIVRRTWKLCAAIGIALALLSLTSITSSLAQPAHVLLLSLPFLAVAAASALYHLPQLEATPIWAALLILPVLGAGIALAPAFEEYPIPTAPAALFGDNPIILLDYQIEGESSPGATVTIDTDWLALDPPDFDYNIFVHALDESGNRLAQIDTQPLSGQRPMTTWQPGEVLTDHYELTIPPDAPPNLHLILGLYNWQTGERLRVGETDALSLTVTPPS
ncbi:MAG: hypothetical protein J5I90_17060 [Caldilineales bacterium]|nr:hypothetical protein [Caldilineales bacterium]